MHIEYQKIHRLGKDEVTGILDHDVWVQEKIDGANLSIWLEDGDLNIGSRTKIIYQNGESLKEFRGAQEYVKNHEGIKRLLEDNPTYRLFGERLVRHTVNYPPEYYNKFFLFDILDNGVFLATDAVDALAHEYGIEKPMLFDFKRYTREELEELSKGSYRGCVGEGVVIKAPNFINKWGNMSYTKLVHDQFKEKNNIIFGNHEKGDDEMKFINEYVTEARILKIVHKIEQNEDRKIDISDTPKVLGMVYYDIFTEELWAFAGKKTIDFGRLQRLSSQRTRVLFHDWLNNDNS